MIKITTRDRITDKDWTASFLLWNTRVTKLFYIRAIIHRGGGLPITYIIPKKGYI